jgi:hypothetical protein
MRKYKIKMHSMEGETFGRLLVVREDAGRSNGGDVVSLCKCECGNEKLIVRGRILSGVTESCGCMKREASTEIIKEAQRKRWSNYEPGESSFNRAYRTYCQNAENRGYAFKLSKEQFRDITQQDCHYCGAPPSNVCKSRGDTGEYLYNGIDRLDNTKGYVIGNFAACCDKCNKAKHTMSYKEYVSFITRSYLHLNSK